MALRRDTTSNDRWLCVLSPPPQPRPHGQERQHAGPAHAGAASKWGGDGRAEDVSARCVIRPRSSPAPRGTGADEASLWTQPDVKFAGRFWQLTARTNGAELGTERPTRRCGSAANAPRRCGGPVNTATRSRRRLPDDGGVRRPGDPRPGGTEGAGRIELPDRKRVLPAVDDEPPGARERRSAALTPLYRFFGIADLTPARCKARPSLSRGPSRRWARPAPRDDHPQTRLRPRPSARGEPGSPR